MIGWVPHVLSAFLAEVAGPAARDAILAEAGFEPAIPFRLDAPYADAACRRIVDVACARLGVAEEDAFALFAPVFLRHARDAFPGFFTHRPTLREFLLHQPEVHDTLSAGLTDDDRGRVAAKFRVEPAGPAGVRILYRSPNRLAGLYAAVARRLAEEMGERAAVAFEAGDAAAAECVMRVEVAPAPAAVARRPVLAS